MILSMNFLIVGYGQMGVEVEGILRKRKHGIVAKVDPISGDVDGMTPGVAEKADMAIEFALPHVALANAKKYCDFGLSAVVGTTGWYDSLDECRAMVESSGIGYLYGPNFSMGAQFFFRLVAYAARLVNPVPEYDILGYEIHHKKKKDSPSGTAHTLARIIVENNTRKDTIVTERLDREIGANELHFGSVRGGELPGTHRVLLDSEADTIELAHTLRNRKGLALGAVLAAEWLEGKSGFYDIGSFVDDLLRENPAP
jgi:4-hydroxy-tetrahydrodipicolinate reductase